MHTVVGGITAKYFDVCTPLLMGLPYGERLGLRVLATMHTVVGSFMW